MVKSNKIWEYHIARRGEHLKIINSGSRMVQDYELRALAEVLGVTSDWLMDEEEK